MPGRDSTAVFTPPPRDRSGDPARTHGPPTASARSEPSAAAPFDGKYVLESLLGEGGMGRVYRARHALLGHVVALKVVHPDLASDPSVRERFLLEARATLELVHPNVIPVREVGASAGGTLYMTLDYSPGRSLRALLDGGGPLSPVRALSIVREVLLALEAAHARLIVHRDLKPENVLVEERGGADVARVCDFGLAKILDGTATSLTGRGIVGTPYYMSPEQAAGEEVDCRADIYAVGCVLYEALSKTKVFDGPSASRVLLKHLTQPPVPLRRRAPEVSAAIEAAVGRALAKEPDDRFQSARAFREAVDALLQGERSGAATLRVLVAEDNLVNRRIVERALTRLGHLPTCVADGLAAVEALDRGAFDVVLMDCEMPRMDGLEATRLLRTRERWRDLPIIGLSAFPPGPESERLLAAGMNGYLSKPLDALVLERELARTTSQRPAKPGRPAVDRSAALARMSNDVHALREVASLFVARATELHGVLEEAAGSSRLSSALHELLGMAQECAAHDLCTAISACEEGRRLEPVRVELARALAELTEVAAGPERALLAPAPEELA